MFLLQSPDSVKTWQTLYRSITEIYINLYMSRLRTLRWEDYLGLSKWIQSNQKVKAGEMSQWERGCNDALSR